MAMLPVYIEREQHGFHQTTYSRLPIQKSPCTLELDPFDVGVRHIKYYLYTSPQAGVFAVAALLIFCRTYVSTLLEQNVRSLRIDTGNERPVLERRLWAFCGAPFRQIDSLSNKHALPLVISSTAWRQTSMFSGLFQSSGPLS